MKVNGPSLSPVGNVKATNKVNPVSKKNSPSPNDRVAVSDKGQIYQYLLQKVKELPSIDEEKVRSVAESIKQGQFKVEVRAIAEKLLSPDQ